MPRFSLFLLILAFCVTACTTAAEQTTAAPPSASPEIDLSTIPAVDKSKHIVPLEEIYFDTFRPINRAVPLSTADEELINSLLDAIPPLYNPRFEAAEAAEAWLDDDALVVGYTDGDQAYAYPVQILNWHEMVSQTINERPVLVSYCPLCRSGVVYDRRLNGRALVFGNTSALYESNMVMVDHQTGSYWMQVGGQALVGELAGEQLQALPSQTTSWQLWKELYPDTRVLSRETGFNRNYADDSFSGFGERLNRTGQFVFPVSENGRDPRLQPGEVVLGVEVAGQQIAYPIEAVGDGVINDTVGGTDLVVFTASEGKTGTAYERVVNGQTLTFVYENGRFTDTQTSSTWLLNGLATAGELEGTQLPPLPVRSTYWYSLIATFPDLTLYSE